MTRIYVIAVLVLLLLASSAAGIWAFKKWRSAEFQNKQLVEYQAVSKDSTHHYINKYRQEVAKTKAQEFTNSTLRKMVDEGLIKIGQYKNVKAKKVEGLGWITIAAQDTDTLNVGMDGSFNLLEPFRGISGTINLPSGGTLTPGTTITIKDSTSIQLNMVVYWQRKGLLRWFGIGRKEYFGEAVSDNPNVTISKLQLVVKKK